MSSRRHSGAAALKTRASVFAALGDETRLRLLARLSSQGPESIVALSARADVTRQAITKHLETLAEAGVVHGTRSGRERIWEIETRRIEKARRCLEDISDQWDAAMARLRAFVEDKP